jgi:type I restriction enzyme M protein
VAARKSSSGNLSLKDDVIEAIISLPPGLFYGTGIPACVLVMNKKQAR